MAAAARKIEGQGEPPSVIIAAAPLTMNRAQALAYTGLAEKLFNRLEQSGQITSRAHGRNGAIIYLREQLDTVVKNLFGGPANDIDEEFGIGG